MSQAEHGVDSQVVLVAVALTPEKLALIEKEVDAQARALSRVDILRVSISKSIIVKASSVEEGIAFSNDYAPEHLILHLENASAQVVNVENAGSVFVGPFTPERFVTFSILSRSCLYQHFTAVETMHQALTIHCPLMVMHDNSVV